MIALINKKEDYTRYSCSFLLGFQIPFICPLLRFLVVLSCSW